MGIIQALNVLVEAARKAQKHGDMFSLQEASSVWNAITVVTQSEDIQEIVRRKNVELAAQQAALQQTAQQSTEQAAQEQ